MQTFYENTTECNKHFDEGFIMWDWFWGKTMFCLFSADSIKSDDESEKSREPRWILGECNRLSSQLPTTVMTLKLHSVTDRLVWKQRWRPKMKNNNPSDANLRNHHNIKKKTKQNKMKKNPNRIDLFLSCDVWRDVTWWNAESAGGVLFFLHREGWFDVKHIPEYNHINGKHLFGLCSVTNVQGVKLMKNTAASPQGAPSSCLVNIFTQLWHMMSYSLGHTEKKNFPRLKNNFIGRTTNQ